MLTFAHGLLNIDNSKAIREEKLYFSHYTPTLLKTRSFYGLRIS